MTGPYREMDWSSLQAAACVRGRLWRGLGHGVVSGFGICSLFFLRTLT